MQRKVGLIYDSALMLIGASFAGMILAGIVIGILQIVVTIIAFVFGFIASLFFYVDFSSFYVKMAPIAKLSYWIFIIFGCVGGLLSAYLEIKKDWEEYKDSEKDC